MRHCTEKMFSLSYPNLYVESVLKIWAKLETINYEKEKEHLY